MGSQKYTDIEVAHVQLSDLLTANQYRVKSVPPSLCSQEFVSKMRQGLVLLSAPLPSFYPLIVFRSET